MTTDKNLALNAKPSFLKQIEGDATKFSAPSSTKVNRVSLKGGRITLICEGVEQELGTIADLILVDASPGLTKMYFSKPYEDTEEVVLPDCWSEDGIAPSSSIQGPVSAKCSGCPKNLWGSKITSNGKKAKACTDYKKLVVMLPGTVAQFYEFRVPPASLSHLNDYVRKMGDRQTAINMVVTKVSYTKELTLEFSPVRWITEMEMNIQQKNKAEINHLLHSSPFEGESGVRPNGLGLVETPVAPDKKKSKRAPKVAPEAPPAEQVAPDSEEEEAPDLDSLLKDL